MGKQLTPEFIIQRTKSDKFEAIKNLNLWGNDLEDVSAIKDLPNLEVLSLSVNRIATLRDFATCPKLTELYLRKNAVSDLSEVQYLCPLKQLRVLWLWDNPCAETPNYRLIVIKMLPQLVKLENNEITGEEREAAAHINVEDGLLAAPPPPPAPVAPPKEIPKKKSEPVHQVEYQEPKAEKPIPPMPKEVPLPKPQHAVKKPSPAPAPAKQDPEPSEGRNENILCAVLALLKELDSKSLELIKRDIDRKIASKKGQANNLSLIHI
eukprot:TRINITY_DN9811_c0_g1_i1.p1 TRINITY_DN9811_c0_g1~~TRINITY_DN9811_c0_g1_i1.p1  ORF type:complete len:265 (-),score=57.87 TRINITY_DN9811_c0_g1_i1:59-853(-)